MMRMLVAAGSLLVALGMALNFGAPASAGSIGGPVILGGDDLTDHGGVDIDGNPVDGWLYMQRALENIGPNVTRSGDDGSVAALGSADPGGVFDGDAGSAIQVAAGEVGRSVTFYEGAAAIQQFFDDLGTAANPSIIWIAGSGASNDLDRDESATLALNAGGISAFVNSGGGLMSHGVQYGWLTVLLPTVITVDDGSSDDLYFTDEGLSDLSPLTLGNINAGPWHNYFQGDFGGLKVLVRSSDIQDVNGNDAAVVIGGATVSITEDIDPPSEEEEEPNCIPGIPGFSCGGQRGGGVSPDPEEPQATAVAQPTQSAVPTVPAPAPAPGRPGSSVDGVISAPDTGKGPQGSDDTIPMVIALTFIVAVGALTTGIVRRRS